MIPRWIVIVLSITLMSCASGELKFRIFSRGPAPPDFNTVVDFMWVDGTTGECDARSWLRARGVAEADIDEMIVKAHLRVRELREECTGKKTCRPGY